MLPSFNYLKATTIEQAIEALQQPGTRLHAGGTDLLGCLRDGVFETSTVVSMAAIPGLDSIEVKADGGLRIGALVTIDEISRHPHIRKHFKGLAQAAQAVASPQLRNQGTIGGNLCQKPRCWYYRGEFDCLRKGGDTCFAYAGQNRYHCILGGSSCYIVHPSDPAAALLAFDATLRVAGPKGVRMMAVADLHVPPADDPTREVNLEEGEVITEIMIPPAAGPSSYRKIRARQSWDFALTGLALIVAKDGDAVRSVRAVLSGVAPIPWRSREVEEVLRGKKLTAESIRAAAEAAVKNADPLEHNAFKVDLVKGIITEELGRY